MPFQKSFVDASGNTNPSAYWHAVVISLNSVAAVGNITYFGFKDADAFASGKQPLPGAVKPYAIEPSEFALLAASTPNGSTLHEVFANAADSFAMAKQDDLDGDNNPVSFFSGATRVA